MYILKCNKCGSEITNERYSRIHFYLPSLNENTRYLQRDNVEVSMELCSECAWELVHEMERSYVSSPLSARIERELTF